MVQRIRKKRHVFDMCSFSRRKAVLERAYDFMGDDAPLWYLLAVEAAEVPDRGLVESALVKMRALYEESLHRERDYPDIYLKHIRELEAKLERCS